MTDKIITTFETTITWFDINDQCPEEGLPVLVKYFDMYKIDDSSLKQIWCIRTMIREGKYFFELSKKSDWSPKVYEWAYLPKFGDEE